MHKNICKYTLFLSLLMHILGCAYQQPMIKTPQTSKLTGVYHEVAAGETLWGISRVYNVELERIVKINRIPNAARIEKDQLIFIPEVAKKVIKDIDKISSLPNKKFAWPVNGEIISYFGSLNNERLNKGIDIRVNSNVNIFATRSGKVVFSDNLKGYGKTIILDHLDGFFTIYSSNQKLLVKLNDNIDQGQSIAHLEDLNDSNSFVHFEIRRGYRPQNPLYYLP